MRLKLREITHTNIGSAAQTQSHFFDSVEWQAIMRDSFWMSVKSFAIEVNNAFIIEISIDVDESGFYSHFMGYGGPIIDIIHTSDVKDIIHALEHAIGKPCKRMKFYPFSTINNVNQNQFIKKTTSILCLTDLSFRKEVLYEIKKAKVNAVSTRELSSKKDIENFYKIYIETAERVGSAYHTPISVFYTIPKIKGSFILGAFRKNHLIAGSVFLCSSDWSYFWWNASDTEGRTMSANYLIMNEAIAVLQKKGVSFLDMASSHSPNIKRSKTLWGAEEVIFFEYSNKVICS